MSMQVEYIASSFRFDLLVLERRSRIDDSALTSMIGYIVIVMLVTCMLFSMLARTQSSFSISSLSALSLHSSTLQHVLIETYS